MINHDEININSYSITNIEKANLDYLEGWFNAEFGYMGIEWAKPRWYLIMKYKDEIIGRIGIIKRIITIDKTNLEIGGLNGVIIKKIYRGNRLLKILLGKAMDFIKKRLKVKFALLLCRDKLVPIYKKYDWYLVDGPTIFEQKNGLKEYDKNTMVINLANFNWPEGIINLNGLPW